MYKIPANTLFIGQNRIFVPQCHSTNSVLAEMIRNTEMTEGTLFITDHQSGGRGQRGNTWEAEPGKNLTFSVMLKPAFLLAKDQFYLTMAISLAIQNFLAERLAAEVKIKWPNDILINDKKICGILVENILSADKIQQSIIGIGLNVNQTSFSILSPTSMKLISMQEAALEEELNLLLEKLEVYYLQLRSAKYELLKKEYQKHLYWMSELHQFSYREEPFIGMINGVDQSGRLTVLRDGKEISFDLKEIKFIG